MSNWFWIGPTLAAILTFLGYALFKYLQGEFNPGLTIEFKQQQASISPSQSLFFVEVEVHNTSKMPVHVRYMEVTLHRLSRYTDEEVLSLYLRAFPQDGSPMVAIPWEQISFIPRQWEEGILTIQPGGRHVESFEFIVPGTYDRIPIRVGIQVVNRPLEEDMSFTKGAVGWKRIGIVDSMDNGGA